MTKYQRTERAVSDLPPLPAPTRLAYGLHYTTSQMREYALAAIAQVRGKAQEPVQPIYYMRDNHTFRQLPENVDAALRDIGEELDAGYRCGMLCTKREGASPRHLHFSYTTPPDEMMEKARSWLAAEISAREAAAAPHVAQEEGAQAAQSDELDINVLRSKRTGRFPIDIENRIREEVDPEFKDRMEKARADLGVEIEAAQSGDARDAARYRWLRSKAFRSAAGGWLMFDAAIKLPQVNEGMDGAFDAAIDAAMSATPSEKEPG